MTNEHSNLGLTKISEQVPAITARHPHVPGCCRRRATWRVVEKCGLVADEGEQR